MDATTILSPIVPSVSPMQGDGGVWPYRWTGEEAERIAGLGFLEGRNVELIDGELIEMSPQSAEHSWAILRMSDLLRNAFGPEHLIRTQLPLAPSVYDRPEPDVSVVRGTLDLYLRAHPAVCLLAVEISCTTQKFDKGKKADLYASAGVADYWVLDLPRRELVVFRDPVESGRRKASYGWRYASVQTLSGKDSLAPLAQPTALLKVADLLPPQ